MEKRIPPVRAVLFDMDGTIADTVPCCVGVQCASLSRLLGREVTFDEIAQGFGLSEDGCIRLVAPEIVDEARRSYIAGLWWEHAARCPEPFPGIPALLAGLRERGMRLGLISGRMLETLAISLAQFGLTGAFDAVAGGDPWREVKDERARVMLGAFGVPPEEAVYVGDSVTDVTFAKAVGMRTAAVCYAPLADRAALESAQPDWVLRTVSELEKTLFALPAR